MSSVDLTRNLDLGEGNEKPLTQQFLTITSAKDLFALPIYHIKEIIGFDNLTEIPLMPPHIRGVINLRGAVVPVIDLSVRFGRSVTKIAKRTCIVILEIDQDDSMQQLGIVVDAVNEVLTVDNNQLDRPPAFGTNIRDDFISGILKKNEDFIIILDVSHVLSMEELQEITKNIEAS